MEAFLGKGEFCKWTNLDCRFENINLESSHRLVNRAVFFRYHISRGILIRNFFFLLTVDLKMVTFLKLYHWPYHDKEQ